MTPEATPQHPGNHFNSLSPAEAERLALLAEECAETIQAIGKILRHGYESWSNRADLEKEVGDIRAAVALLLAAGDVALAPLFARERDKLKRLRVSAAGDQARLLHHQSDETLRAALYGGALR